MRFIEIPLQKLLVNPDNDRHGPKGSEQNAIDWLFSEHREKMISLANDIVACGEVFDAPLVIKRHEKYIVYDGNRRVTCLKAICGLCRVPDDLQSLFAELRRKFNCAESMEISCQVETNQSVVDQIVSRRHNGTDGGRGQLGWDTRAKQNHAKRIGVATQYPIAEAIEEFLEKTGYPFSSSIKRSTLYRLVNTRKRQALIGMHLNEDGTLHFTRDKSEVLAALTKIADDIVDGQLTLKNVLNLEGVEAYMAQLSEAGFLENPKLSGIQESQKDSQREGYTQSRTPSKKPDRTTLIPKKTYEVAWPHGLHKAEKLWEELQYSLIFKRHEVSIPIAFRALIDLLTEFANKRTDKPKSADDKLASRIKHVANCFVAKGLLTSKEYQDLERLLGNTGSTRELEVLHRCIHSRTTLPSSGDLIAIWTAFEHYLLLCIQAKKD